MDTLLPALQYDRYKYIVQVYIGERREQGVRVGCRCFWDANSDNQASESFTNVRTQDLIYSTYHVIIFIHVLHLIRIACLPSLRRLLFIYIENAVQLLD